MGIELLAATVRGAGLSIDGNLKAIKEPSYVERVQAEREQLAVDSARDAAQALAILTGSGQSRR
jgi:formiminotetrahydrofolate cyclodeaminase